MLAQSTEPATKNASTSLLRPYMPELDSLRGIAVLGVVLYHAFAWRYAPAGFGAWAKVLILASAPGWVGVNLFFVLSGFLITGILLNSKHKPNYYRRFYTRRALRILPAYYSLLIMLLLLRTSSYSFVGLSFIYLSNVTDLLGVPCAYGPLWSLAVEEHFYILWPAVVRRFSTRHIAWILVGIILLTPILRGASFSTGWGSAEIAWYTWFVADGLAAGSLLAISLRALMIRRQAKHLCYWLLASASLAAVIGRPFGILTRERLLGAALQFTVLTIFFAGFLLMFLLLGSSSSKRYVNLAPLRFLGFISNGLYLDHLLAFRVYDRICSSYWPRLIPSDGHFALILLRFGVAGGAAILLAYLSRRFFEEKFLRLKNSWEPKPSVETSETQPALAPVA